MVALKKQPRAPLRIWFQCAVDDIQEGDTRDPEDG